MSTHALIDDIILYAKKTHGWSQRKLAEQAGITQEGLSRAKKGGGRLDTIERLAAAAEMRLIAIPNDDYVEEVMTGKLLGDF